MGTARLAAALLLASGCASAGTTPPPVAPLPAVPVHASTVEYRDGDVLLEGRLFLPLSLASDALPPAVLVVHEWWGRTEHADRSAARLASEGFAAFAVDMYGRGRTTADPKQAGAWAGEIRGNPALLRSRLDAAVEVLRGTPGVDASRVACIGFCFGGTVSLEAAWSGMDLRAAVSFHGNPTVPGPERAAGVKASLLVLHGADDPLVPGEALEAWHAAVRENGYDAVFVAFAGAVHSFTNPGADGTFNPGVRHHPLADARSWSMAVDFLRERLR